MPPDGRALVQTPLVMLRQSAGFFLSSEQLGAARSEEQDGHFLGLPESQHGLPSRSTTAEDLDSRLLPPIHFYF